MTTITKSTDPRQQLVELKMEMDTALRRDSLLARLTLEQHVILDRASALRADAYGAQRAIENKVVYPQLEEIDGLPPEYVKIKRRLQEISQEVQLESAIFSLLRALHDRYFGEDLNNLCLTAEGEEAAARQQVYQQGRDTEEQAKLERRIRQFERDGGPVKALLHASHARTTKELKLKVDAALVGITGTPEGRALLTEERGVEAALDTLRSRVRDSYRERFKVLIDALYQETARRPL